MYHFGIKGSIIWSSHILMGGLISYVGYNMLNNNNIDTRLIYLIIIIGISAILNHSYLWVLKEKLNKMYHFGMEGWLIWFSHIIIGSYLSYVGHSLLNNKNLRQIDSLILIVLGVLGALYHLHTWYYNLKQDEFNLKDDNNEKAVKNNSKKNNSKFISFLGKKKYNLESFIMKHPGGSIIKKTLGKDMSNVWKRYGVSWHMKNKKVQNVLKSLEVN